MSVSNTALFSFRTNLDLLDSFIQNNNFYIFAGKSTPWTNDFSPPTPNNSVKSTEYQTKNEINFGKYVPNTAISYMAQRYDWNTGTVYSMYDDLDQNIFNEQYYVVTYENGAYNVFKCLNNNNGAVSQFQPLLADTSPDDQYYQTADGYQWKFMYTFDETAYEDLVTIGYIPVMANSEVVGNATSGSLDSYVVSSNTSFYSYTNGYFTEIAVGGNTLFFGIQGSDTSILEVTANSYQLGETVVQRTSTGTSNGIVYSQVTANSTVTILTLNSIQGIFNLSNSIIGTTSNSVSLVENISSPVASSNNNFYDGCAIYIYAGTGAGQLNTVEEYIVVGNARRVLLSNPYTTLPDLTSKYIISPAIEIYGDGANATGYCVMNSSTSTIQSIQPISRGNGYSYANVYVVGNTGNISSNTAGMVRAIISPIGGHGSNPLSELNATNISFNCVFANTESNTIPGSNTTYRKIGVIVDPQFANVGLTYSYTTDPTFPITSNGYVIGETSGSVGFITSTDPASNLIYLTNVVGVFQSGELLVGYDASNSEVVNTTMNVSVTEISGQNTAFNNRTTLTCLTSTLSGGAFTQNEKVVQVIDGVDNGYAYIHDVESSGSNTIIYLTEVYGYFQASNTSINDYKYLYDDASRQTTIEIIAVQHPDLVQYSGNVIYYENIIPVIRNSSQTETVNIIVGVS